MIFSRGALEAMACPHFGIRPSFVISNDWMTGFIPGFSKLDKRYNQTPWLAAAHFIHMLHNGGGDYHGKLPVHSFGEDHWPSLNLSAEHFFGFQDPNNPQLLNPTAAAIRHASAGFLTVSKPYANQLIHGNASDGLDSILWSRKESAFGISNGISRATIASKISQLPVSSVEFSGNDRETFLLRKSAMKVVLQNQLGLAHKEDSYLISFVGRLAEQKGLHLLSGWANDEGVSVLESILLREPRAQIIVAGPPTPNDSSVEELDALMGWLQHKHSNRVVFLRDFISHSLALEIIFGSDLFLMPSRFEPGGITQLEALAAGTLVVGRNVGGIGATVENVNTEKGLGTGFLCEDYSCRGFRDTLLWALDTLKDEELRMKLIDNARFANHDWSDRVPKYRALFQHICVNKEILHEAPWHDDHVKILQQVVP